MQIISGEGGKTGQRFGHGQSYTRGGDRNVARQFASAEWSSRKEGERYSAGVLVLSHAELH